MLYKLLASYPTARLMLVQTHHSEFCGRQLPGAKILNLPDPPKLLPQRLRTLWELSYCFLAPLWAALLYAPVRSFTPEVFVVLLHGWSAEVALRLSRWLSIPLCVIVHDSAAASMTAPRALSEFRVKRWRLICERATECIAVSPFMAAEIGRIAGRRASILLPGLRPMSTIVARAKTHTSGNLTFAFIGRVSAGYSEALAALELVLRDRGHRLVLYSPQAQSFLRDTHAESGVDGGWVLGEKIAETLAAEADVTVLPMSFRHEDDENTRVSFPSKLCEYCSAALPMLIVAPPEASIVQWMRSNSLCGVIVDRLEPSRIRAGVEILEDPIFRAAAGDEARRLAEKVFSHDATFAQFAATLSAALSRSQ